MNLSTETEMLDMMIVGAGLSGIAAAYHFQTAFPGKKYAVLEARESIGGTWDLFRYPGIRSDSDMYTLGFSFNLWSNPQAIADGPSILQYIRDTAAKFGIDKNIRFKHKVTDASWSDQEKCWTLSIDRQDGNGAQLLKSRFLFMCSGYYDYSAGYNPEMPGEKHFTGRIIHPQQWDQNLDYAGKKVVVIGSGATAITLVPEMAKKAEKVVMLQRSPTYVVNLPSKDRLASFLGKILPDRIAYSLIRWKNILFSLGFYNASRRWPSAVRKLILAGVKSAMGKEFDLKHFSPNYNPWDQRLCVVPDNDLFEAIKAGKAEVVTDAIAHFTDKGILLKSGRQLEADIVVKATGLKVQLMGGMSMHINQQRVHTGDAHCYRGVMFADAPNFFLAVGYTNSSWTLKCDLNCMYAMRVIHHMEKLGKQQVVPRFDAEKFNSEPLLDFDAGYIKRAEGIIPKQGSAAPWKVYQNYLKDTFALRYGRVDDEYLKYQ